MTHEVFISYSSKNAEYANAVHEKLDENGIKCWLDVNNIRTATNFAQEIIDGLNQAKVVVLIYSKDSDDSKYVYREIETAFEANKHIVPLKIDESFPQNLEFFLRGTQWLDASPQSLDKKNITLDECYDEVVETVKKLKDVSFEPGTHIDRQITPQAQKSFFEKYSKYIAVAVVLLVAVGGFLAYSTMNSTDTSNSLNETVADIGYIGLQDNGAESYSYYVYGTLTQGSNSSGSDIVHIDFYDSNGKVVESSDSKISDVDGNILGSADLSDDNVAKVTLELQNSDEKVLFTQESDNIISE